MSQAAMPASASARFSRAKARAFSAKPSFCRRETSWAMTFQCPGGVAVPGPPDPDGAPGVRVRARAGGWLAAGALGARVGGVPGAAVEMWAICVGAGVRTGEVLAPSALTLSNELA